MSCYQTQAKVIAVIEMVISAYLCNKSSRFYFIQQNGVILFVFDFSISGNFQFVHTSLWFYWHCDYGQEGRVVGGHQQLPGRK